MLFLSYIAFFLSLGGILTVSIINPMYLSMLWLVKRKKKIVSLSDKPIVSLIIVVHNGEDLIAEKIKNSQSLIYNPDKLEIIIYSDGSTDKTQKNITPFLSKQVKLFSSRHHIGKFEGINRAVRESKGDILVFTDADAILDCHALTELLKHFSDSGVGGVCGFRVITEKDKSLADAQISYISMDTMIKRLESRIGSISSNDGKLYAIRRELFVEIPPAVTDDLYEALNVVFQHKRFIFESSAKVAVRLPSRTVEHEILRRRRIVSRSLMGIFKMRVLLNPFKYGMYSLELLINKVIRRLLPILLIMLLFSNLLLIDRSMFYALFFAAQILFYLWGASYPLYFEKKKSDNILGKISSKLFYFCVGNYGMFMGIMDFIQNKQPVKWTPVKTDLNT